MTFKDNLTSANDWLINNLLIVGLAIILVIVFFIFKYGSFSTDRTIKNSNKTVLLLAVGFLLGYIISAIFSGQTEGEEGLLPSNLIFQVGDYFIHLHHWIFSSIVIIWFALRKYSNLFVYGILTGITLQGLMYTDFLKIIYK